MMESVDAIQEKAEDSKLDLSHFRESTIDIYNNICRRLKIVTVDVDKVLRAKELLSFLQRRKAFMDLIGLDDDDSVQKDLEDLQRLTSKHSLRMLSSVHASDSEDMNYYEGMGEDMCLMPFNEERWANYFTDFQILGDPESINANENNKCIELVIDKCENDLNMYLHSGVRCFMLDLFRGPLRDSQDQIVKLREAEIAVSKEFGFPVSSTIIAKLSPRYQYTGYLDTSRHSSIQLKAGFKTILTTDRNYSMRCTSRLIYVNARFLLIDVRKFDIILIGQDIQLMVRSVRQDHLNCCVCRAGTLTSRMPVLFPARCSRYRVSYEEVEDLTFAREVGINVVISNIAGTLSYINDLERIMVSLQCDHLRLYARIVINEVDGCAGEYNWIVQRYDGLLVELAEPSVSPDILKLCRNGECILQMAYEAKKPIIMDAWQVNEQRLRVDPAHYYHFFFYPDKYLIRCDQTSQNTYLNFLQNAIFDQILPVALSKMPLCDISHTGADGLARAIVSASIELNAAAIIVCGVTTRMVQKIAHFRPKTPVLFVSHLRSPEDYVSLYHNVTMLPFRTSYFIDHRRNTFRKAVFGLAYLSSRKIIKTGDQIILVYNYASGTSFPEKYLIYTFDRIQFVDHLMQCLFPRDNSMGLESDGIYMCSH